MRSPYLDLPTDPRVIAELSAENAAYLRELARESGDEGIAVLADVAQLRAEAGFL